MKKLIIFCTQLIICIITINTQAKNVDLFNAQRGKINLHHSSPPQKKHQPINIKFNKELIAIQRIGNKYTLTLKNKTGNKERFIWYAKGDKSVVLEKGYKIKTVKNRGIILELDKNIHCQDNSKKNIGCLSTNLLVLTINRDLLKIKKKVKQIRKKNISPKEIKKQKIMRDNASKNPFLLQIKNQKDLFGIK